MTLYLETPGEFVVWTGQRINGVAYQPNVDQLWFASQLAEIGLYEPAPADPIPDDKISTGQYVARVGNVVKFVHTLNNKPALTLAQRREAAINDMKNRRWEKETGGVTVTLDGGPVLVGTQRGDDRNNLHIQLTAIGAGMRADPSVFNLADGVPREISNADMLMIIGSALQHVQQQFDLEGEVTAALNAAHTNAAMDTAIGLINVNWPV